jgi:glycosyltransferase involved in cell wall biosynthesis
MPECCLPFLKNNKNIPVIYQKHGSANPVAKSKFTYGRIILFRKFFEYVLQLIYKKAQWIIAIDRSTHKEIIKRRGKKRSSLLMNAVDMNKFFPDRVQRNDARKHYALKKYDNAILFVGRIEITKGPKLLLDCIPWFKERECPFHIFFAGEGTYKTYLENYVMRMKYNASVTFLGHLPHDYLPKIYNMSDVLILPSETEGAPMVVLESLACGTPVVASNVGGIPDIVSDGINGIVLNDLSPEKLAFSIISILFNKLSRQEISQSVRTFSASNFVDSLDSIITNVLQQNNK